PAMVVAVDVQDVAIDLLAEGSGIDAEQLGDLLARERGLLRPQEELAGLAVEGHVPERDPGEPGSGGEPRHGLVEPIPVKRGVGRVELRKVERRDVLHGSGPYSL